MERLGCDKKISETERKEIVKKMVKGYEELAAVNEDLIGNFSLLKDGTN